MFEYSLQQQQQLTCASRRPCGLTTSKSPSIRTLPSCRAQPGIRPLSATGNDTSSYIIHFDVRVEFGIRSSRRRHSLPYSHTTNDVQSISVATREQGTRPSAYAAVCLWSDSLSTRQWARSGCKKGVIRTTNNACGGCEDLQQTKHPHRQFVIRGWSNVEKDRSRMLTSDCHRGP